MAKKLTHVLLAGAASLALTACGGGDNAASDTSAKTETTAPQQTTDTSDTTDAAAVQPGGTITSQADMPRTMFALPAKPSELVAAQGEDFIALRDALEADVDALLTDYTIEDAGTKKGVLATKRAILLQKGEWDAAIAITDQVRALEDKAAAKETAGVIGNAYARVKRDNPGADEATIRELLKPDLEAALAKVDLSVARDTLEQTKGQMQMMNAGLLNAALEGQIDVMVEQAGMEVDRDLAGSIVGIAYALETMPYNDVIAEAVSNRLDAEPEGEKVDLWAERSVEVTDGAPVVIAVWDTGVDPDVQGDRMWTNPDYPETGTKHGIAFNEAFEPEDAPLLVEAKDYAEGMDGLLDLMKGSLDNTAGLTNTDEAEAFRTKMGSLDADSLMTFQKEMSVLGNYVHGQHVADISADGNAAAQIMNVRMSWPTDPLPTEPFDEAFAEGLVRAAKDATAMMKANDVKVANMSWRLTQPSIEALLQITGAEKDADARKARADRIFAIMRDGLTEAFEAAPDTLFIAGAGNEDENVEFVSSVPAGINLPNLITVGAVDQALQPAGFTSYGQSIDVYANGFEIPGRVPGGRTLNLSGTSMAAPQVANLAAKLFAVNPDLSVADVRKIIEETATKEGKLSVVHPANAVAKARGS